MKKRILASLLCAALTAGLLTACSDGADDKDQKYDQRYQSCICVPVFIEPSVSGSICLVSEREYFIIHEFESGISDPFPKLVASDEIIHDIHLIGLVVA